MLLIIGTKSTSVTCYNSIYVIFLATPDVEQLKSLDCSLAHLLPLTNIIIAWGWALMVDRWVGGCVGR